MVRFPLHVCRLQHLVPSLDIPENPFQGFLWKVDENFGHPLGFGVCVAFSVSITLPAEVRLLGRVVERNPRRQVLGGKSMKQPEQFH